MASTITVSTQPQSQTVNLKSYIEDVATPATFSVVATALSSVNNLDVPVYYQWKRSTGGAYSNAPGSSTASTYTVIDAPVTASGYNYKVTITAQDASPVDSSVATLTVADQFANYATNTETGSARYRRLFAIEAI